MREYALIMLNIREYACIYMNKQYSEYARILNVSDAVHSINSLYELLSSHRDRDVLRTQHCQTFKMEPFAKRIIPEPRRATRHF